jgi:hypothetical protein
MTGTQQARKEMQAELKARGATPIWMMSGEIGRLEGWQLNGRVLILHSLVSNGGVELYQPTPGVLGDLIAALDGRPSGGVVR